MNDSHELALRVPPSDRKLQADLAWELAAKTLLLQSQLDYVQASDEMTLAIA